MTVATMAVALPRRLAAHAWDWLSRQTFNPVFVRDGRSMFRGKRMVMLQFAYIVALIGVMAITAWATYQSRVARMVMGPTLPEFGRSIFVGMFETQVTLLLFVVVAYSAGSIVLEREKQTYEALAITSLTSAEVVLGKIASITSLCYLLMFTSAPLAAFSLFFGGVSPGEMFVSYGLLALKIPLWASLGIMASIIASRSIAASALTLVLVGIENALSVSLMNPFTGGFTSLGLFSPFVAPVAAESPLGFKLFAWPIHSWLLPIPYALLLTGLLIVGASEAMPHYRPQRSPLLRALILATVFFMIFLLAAAIVAGRPGGAVVIPLSGLMVLVWALAAIFVPVFTSYPVVGAHSDTPVTGWSKVGPARWFQRDARGGGGYCLLLWAAGLAGLLLAAVLALLSAHIRKLPSGWPGAPEMLVMLSIYALSLIAYSAWGAALALTNRGRREVAMATVLPILFLSSVTVIYSLGYNIMRKVPSDPALVLASPAAAASVVLSHGARWTIWQRFTVEQGLIYGLGYPILLLCAAYIYYEVMRARAARSAE